MTARPGGGCRRDPAQGAPEGRHRYILPGVWAGMENDPAPEHTISSIDELCLHEALEKEISKRLNREQREYWKGRVLSYHDLIQMRRQCKSCPIHIQRRETLKHPLQTALSIFRGWMYSRVFRKSMINDLADSENNDSGRTPEGTRRIGCRRFLAKRLAKEYADRIWKDGLP